MENKNNNFSFILVGIIIFLIITLIGTYFYAPVIARNHAHDHLAMHKNMETEMGSNIAEHREMYLAHKNLMVSNQLLDGKYKCCLETPCNYCLEKTPKHGEGASCSCLEDVMNGLHPCGECIGEILEGHGNKYIAAYFATAIAEEVGITHLPTLQQIIFEKYGVPVEDQI